MIELTDQPIDHQAALQAVAHPNAGANLLFVGTTRQWTGDVETTELKYECYQEMAEKEIRKLCDQASQRWDLLNVSVIHRLGVVPVGEASLAVAVSSAHRLPSFEAGQWLIERLKQVVPIWKQEVDASGKTEWVHPEQEAGR